MAASYSRPKQIAECSICCCQMVSIKRHFLCVFWCTLVRVEQKTLAYNIDTVNVCLLLEESAFYGSYRSFTVAVGLSGGGGLSVLYEGCESLILAVRDGLWSDTRVVGLSGWLPVFTEGFTTVFSLS